MAKKINKSMAVTGRVLNVDSKEERAGDINKIRRYNEEQKKLWEADKEGRTHIVYIRTDKLNNIIPFIVRRNKFEGSKTWFYCGYVGVPKTHHAFGQSINGWSDCFFDLRCHGGLTYSDYHTLIPGYWFFGFDCGHAGDFISPDSVQNHQKMKFHGKEYVIENCENMVNELEILELKFREDEYLQKLARENKLKQGGKNA